MHYRDFVPGYDSMMRDGEYRDADYVVEQVKELARQLAEMKP